jgi:ubiquinol oxidase
MDYWRLQPGATVLDVMYAVRADEGTHRFVNHTLANIDQMRDVNPFALRDTEMAIKGSTPGWTRDQAQAHVRESYALMKEGDHHLETE